MQFFENYFKPEWYGKIRSFIEQAFGPNGQNLKAIVTNGIGANDQFMWSLIKMYNENKPAGAPVWYHAATAREFARLYSEGKIKPDSTIFVDITRSGATWEGLEVASRSLQEGFNKRIAIVNGGPSKDIAIAAAQARSKTEKTTVAPLVIELSPDIGGRNMHRKTSIYYTVQTIAGIFLPSMDSVEFARLHDKFDRANDFSDEDGSLPVSAGRFLHGAMYLLGAEHIVFMTNTESLRRAGTEWEQYIMEGSNKRDVISMGIHDLADEVYEPPAVLETLVSSPAGKKCVGMALLDRSSPTYDKDRKRVKSVAEAMPVMILTVEGTKITDGTGKVIDVGMTPNQQAALDILWTDLVTVFTSLLRVDANSNPNVKKVREYTSDRVAGWRDNERKYAQDLIGQGKTELLVSSGNPGSPAIGADGKQNAMNTATQARQLGKDIAAQLAGKLKGRDRLNLFVGSEGLQEFVGGLRREAYGSELGRQGWIVQTALFPLWSHKGLEGNLANQAESNTPGPLLGDKTVNIFINTRRLIDNKVTGRGFKNTVDIEVDAGGGKAVEKRQLVPPRKGDGATVEGANVHQTNDAMTMPNIRRMAEVSPTVLFECNEADEDVKALIKAFYESFTGELARLSRAGRDGEKKYPAGEGAGKVTAEQIYQVSTIPERDSLQKYLASLALRGALDNRAVIIAHDTAVAPGQVAQAGERPINKYLEGKLVDIRATGRKLLDNIAQAAQELQAAGIPYKVVTIAGNSTMNEVGQYLTRIGKVLNIQNPDNRYIPIIGLYEVALRIAYDSSIDDVLLSLNRIAINPDNRPFTKDDVEALLSRGVLMILPKIVPVNPSEAAAAYKAAQQALISL
ncbi:MAG: hypothetical protein NTY34_03025 [Candidatus Omnitrophica bacterium]|nr:hypothetical protein [Candidatus Omnitrophota bacterium]